MSSTGHHLVGIALATVLAAAPAPVCAQVDPFQTVSSIVTWFERLNANWDRVVTEQERRQLIRSTDEIRSLLYRIRGNSELLLGSVPDSAPDEIERRQLTSQIDSLQRSVETLQRTGGGLITQLGARDEETVNMFTSAVVARSDALRNADTVLRRSINNPRAWRPDDIRRRLHNGLVALARAQTAVTRFRNRLAAQR